MSWQEIHITASADEVAKISQALETFGALSVSFCDGADQPIYEPSRADTIVWDKTIVIGLFPSDFVMNAIFAYLEGQKKSFTMKELPDKDWVRESLDSFKPIHFGKKLCICPSWHTPPDTQKINVILDPGLAFGTGSHPTTALCLEWLDQFMTGGETIIDYGCGSGILSIAALKLGAKSVWAVDHDEQALLATTLNSEKNDIAQDALKTYLPTETLQKADIVIANILAQPLINLAPRLAKYTKPGGFIALSGILTSQVTEVLFAYQPFFEIQVYDFKEEWVCLAGKRTLSGHDFCDKELTTFDRTTINSV